VFPLAGLVSTLSLTPTATHFVGTRPYAQGKGLCWWTEVVGTRSARGADEAAGEDVGANLANLANFSGTGRGEFFTFIDSPERPSLRCVPSSASASSVVPGEGNAVSATAAAVDTVWRAFIDSLRT
jgi:hypothetical protein